MRERNGGDVLAHQRIVLPSSGGSTTSNSTSDMVTPPGFDQGPVQSGPLVQGANQDAALAVAASQPIITPHEAQYTDQAQFECDKRAVYKHPLFPLLALLFEKCEMATRTSNDTPFSDSFHQDLEAFVQHQERDRKPFLANDPEVDGLMIKAIQVLRIHLLELDKVQELCKDFCNRYIACLKGKMQSENLLRSDYFDGGGGGGGGGGHGGGYGGGGGASLSSNSNSPHHSSFSSNGDVSSISPPINMHHHNNNNNNNHSSNNNNNNNNGGFLQQHPHLNPLHHTQSQNDSHQSQFGPSPPYPPSCNSPLDQASSVGGDSAGSPLGIVHGGTPLSQIGANSCPPPPHSSSSGSVSGGQDPFVQSQCETPPTPGSSVDDDDDYLGGRKKPKRGVLPKHATSIMRSWLFQHIVHPYPTEDEKRQIAAQTNLTLLQVNNWFINARRRILQPMLDASNPETPAPPKSKKMKTHSSKSAMKYWSDNMQCSSGNPSSGPPGGMQDDQENESGDDESDDSCNDQDPDHDPQDLLIDNSDSSQQ